MSLPSPSMLTVTRSILCSQLSCSKFLSAQNLPCPSLVGSHSLPAQRWPLLGLSIQGNPLRPSVWKYHVIVSVFTVPQRPVRQRLVPQSTGCWEVVEPLRGGDEWEEGRPQRACPSRGQCDTGPSFFCCVAVSGGFCSSRVSAPVGYLSAGRCLHCGKAS